jgi:hypothetical protein
MTSDDDLFGSQHRISSLLTAACNNQIKFACYQHSSWQGSAVLELTDRAAPLQFLPNGFQVAYEDHTTTYLLLQSMQSF